MIGVPSLINDDWILYQSLAGIETSFAEILRLLTNHTKAARPSQ